jgi:hypothetical protein
VDDRVQWRSVHQLGGNAPYRVPVREVGNDKVSPAFHERVEGRCAVLVPRVHDHIVPGGLQRLGRQAAEPVC